MKISPLEIEQQSFNKAFRGYDPVEVTTYLEMLAGEFEGLIAENAELKEKMKEFSARLKSYQELEQTLQDTLLTSQKTAEDTKRNVEKEADLIIKEAHLESERMLEEAKLRLTDLNRKISDLQMSKKRYVSEFKAFLSAQWHLLENIESGEGSSESSVSIKRRRERPKGEELKKILDSIEETDPQQQAGPTT
ncbi:DivIVA domain-containing protein [bacterium]|nr:DivIVA domain-containing protein [bacterium]